MAFVFSIQSYDGTPRIKLTRKMARLVVGLRIFTRLLRKRIFPTEPFDEAGAAAYRHIVAFGALQCRWDARDGQSQSNRAAHTDRLRDLALAVGDAPIGTASWRVVADDGGSVVAVEHFGVLEEKRRRGYGKQLLQAVVEVRPSALCFDIRSRFFSPAARFDRSLSPALHGRGAVRSRLVAVVAGSTRGQDVKQTLVDWQVAAEAIAVHVPESDSIVGIKMLQLGGFELDPQPRVVNSVSCLRLLLRG